MDHPHVGERHPCELRPPFEQPANLRVIIGFDCRDEVARGRALHIRLELGPALEPIGTRQHELSVVERERGATGATVVAVHFAAGIRRIGLRGLKQLFRLSLQLLEIGMVSERAGGKRSGHDELLPAKRFGHAPGVRSHGLKRGHRESLHVGAFESGGRCPSRGHGFALTRFAEYTVRCSVLGSS